MLSVISLNRVGPFVVLFELIFLFIRKTVAISGPSTMVGYSQEYSTILQNN
jgi:hypothetical protein